jgi:hypothetical protein
VARGSPKARVAKAATVKIRTIAKEDIYKNE